MSPLKQNQGREQGLEMTESKCGLVARTAVIKVCGDQRKFAVRILRGADPKELKILVSVPPCSC